VTPDAASRRYTEPLSAMVAWLTSKAKPTQGQKTNDATDKPVDVNQFKDTFQPDDGVFSPNLPLPPQDVQAWGRSRPLPDAPRTHNSANRFDRRRDAGKVR
jgi:hypothetical protein